jgi:hypothetical protein
LEAKHEFDHVSKLIKAELARFEQERIEDFKDSLHAFLEGMISRQKDVRGICDRHLFSADLSIFSSSRVGKTIKQCY